MDGFVRSVGDGITGLVGGALDKIGPALSGIGNALAEALPAGSLPVIGIAAVIVILWLVIRR